MHDVRYALRTLRSTPVFTCVAVLTLTIAIGGNIAIFSLLYQVLLRPLPFPAPDRLVSVHNVYLRASADPSDVSIPDYLDRRRATAIQDAALFAPRRVVLSIDGNPEQIAGLAVTPSLFTTLGREPLLGRAFTDADVASGAAARVAIITYATWRSTFGGRASVVGSELTLDGEARTIVGVLPPDFELPDRDAAVLVPFAFTAQQMSDAERGNEFSRMIARLRPGATIPQLDAQLDAITNAVAARVPARAAYMRSSGFTGRATSMQAERGLVLRTQLYLVQGAVLLVLLIACANVGNLLLMRLTGRRRELAVRAAIGAPRTRILRQLLVEAMLLSSAGGTLGLVAGWAGLRALVHSASEQLPPSVGTSLDLPVLALTIFVIVITAIVFAALPAMIVLRTPSAELLKADNARGSSGRGSNGTRRLLAAGEAALALMLLVGAGLLIKSFARLTHTDAGFAPDGVLTAEVALPSTRYETSDQRRAFWLRLQDRMSTLPGVNAAGLVSTVPLSAESNAGSFDVVGEPEVPGALTPHAFQDVVLGEYFRAMRIPLLQGRIFTDADTPDATRVVVIDAWLAKRQFGGRDPVGHELNFGSPRNYRIVGVVGTVNGRDLATPIEEGRIYFSAAQVPPETMSVVLKATADLGPIPPEVRLAVRAIDPQQPIARVRAMTTWIETSLQPRRTPMVLLSVFGGVSLLLSAIGLYGVLAFGVAQRMREFGIRQALGADRRAIFALVLREGIKTVLAGLILGVGGALLSVRLLRALLFGVEGHDPVVMASAAALLFCVAVAACSVPALRATRVDPVMALRAQ